MAKMIKIWEKYYMVFLKGLGGTLWISAVVVALGTVLGQMMGMEE